MLEHKVLVGKALGAVYAGGPGAVAVQEVAALAHEVGDDAVEARALVALRLALRVPVLARAVLPEVLGRARHHVLEELKGYAAEGLAFWWGIC